MHTPGIVGVNRPRTGERPNGHSAAPRRVSARPAPRAQHDPDTGSHRRGPASRHCRTDRSPHPVTTQRAHPAGHRPAHARTCNRTWVNLVHTVGWIDLVEGSAEVVGLRVGGGEDLLSGADSSSGTTRVLAQGRAKGTTASGMPARRGPQPRAPHRSTGRTRAASAPN